MAEFAKQNINIEENVIPINSAKKAEPKVNEDVKQVKKEIKAQNICVVSITNSSPYDTSELPNNATTYYTNINYLQLKELYQILKNDSDTNNMVYKSILNYVKDPDTKVFFDFKCSSDCHSGSIFVDDKTTLTVFKLINTMTRKGCNIVVGDHSMGALFVNWDKYRMDMKSPILISNETTSGPFKMTGVKQDFINSDHPILKDLGDMSSSETVDIEFINMSGTKIFSVKPDFVEKVKIISKGKPIGGFIDRVSEQLVHCEFKYRNGMIIVSATHWCNLTNVNSQVDVNKVREQYTQKYGDMARQQFEAEYQEAVTSGCRTTVNRVVSDSVKFMCSNVATPSKSNYQQAIIDNLKKQPVSAPPIFNPDKIINKTNKSTKTNKIVKSLNKSDNVKNAVDNVDIDKDDTKDDNIDD